MTYYRYRKELLEFGIDIANVQDVDKPLDNVVPLVRVLEALPASIPDWAYEKKIGCLLVIPLYRYTAYTLIPLYYSIKGFFFLQMYGVCKCCKAYPA